MKNVHIEEAEFNRMHMGILRNEYEIKETDGQTGVFDTETGKFLLPGDEKQLGQQRLLDIANSFEALDIPRGFRWYCWWEELGLELPEQTGPARYVEVPFVVHAIEHEWLLEFISELQKREKATKGEAPNLMSLASPHIRQALHELEERGYPAREFEDVKYRVARIFLYDWLNCLGEERSIRYIFPEEREQEINEDRKSSCLNPDSLLRVWKGCRTWLFP